MEMPATLPVLPLSKPFTLAFGTALVVPVALKFTLPSVESMLDPYCSVAVEVSDE